MFMTGNTVSNTPPQEDSPETTSPRQVSPAGDRPPQAAGHLRLVQKDEIQSETVTSFFDLRRRRHDRTAHRQTSRHNAGNPARQCPVQPPVRPPAGNEFVLLIDRILGRVRDLAVRGAAQAMQLGHQDGMAELQQLARAIDEAAAVNPNVENRQDFAAAGSHVAVHQVREEHVRQVSRTVYQQTDIESPSSTGRTAEETVASRFGAADGAREQMEQRKLRLFHQLATSRTLEAYAAGMLDIEENP